MEFRSYATANWWKAYSLDTRRGLQFSRRSKAPRPEIINSTAVNVWRGHSCPRNLTTIKEAANPVQSLPGLKTQGLKLWGNFGFSYGARHFAGRASPDLVAGRTPATRSHSPPAHPPPPPARLFPFSPRY